MTSLRTLLLSVLLCTGIAGCADEPWLMDQSTLTPQKMTLVENRHIVKKPLTQLSGGDIAEAANKYSRAGAGPMYVVVAYNEQGKGVDHSVDQKVHAIASELQSRGVAARDIVASTVPLETVEPVALIAFDTLEAQGPQNCTDMPGLKTLPGEESDFDYKLGCGVKSMMARQIAHPADLEGKAGLGGHNDGARAANVVNTQVRAYEGPRDYLPTYVISELAGSGS